MCMPMDLGRSAVIRLVISTQDRPNKKIELDWNVYQHDDHNVNAKVNNGYLRSDSK